MRTPADRIGDISRAKAAVEGKLLDENGNIRPGLSDSDIRRLLKASTQLRKELGMPALDLTGI
jgi:hypothetical protein